MAVRKDKKHFWEELHTENVKKHTLKGYMARMEFSPWNSPGVGPESYKLFVVEQHTSEN